MSQWTIVPQRGLACGKTRLSSILDGPERYQLNVALLGRVLGAVAQHDGDLTRCIVVSESRDTVDFASDSGAVPVWGHKRGGLNESLEAARDAALTAGARSILVLAADLPLATGADIQSIYRSARGSACVIVPDSRDSGTNGILMTAAALCLPFAFGLGSLERHRQGCRQMGIEPIVLRNAALAFDVDVPVDYTRLMEQRSRETSACGAPAAPQVIGVGACVTPH